MKNLKIPNTDKQRVVILGGGFAGMNAALHLKDSAYQVVLIDKHNYHTFQPLLYQVATGGLEPTSIAYPLRKLLKKHANIFFRMAEALFVDVDNKIVETNIGDISYDKLVIALGSTTNFFGLPEDSTSKMKTLKSITESLDLRSFLLENFEDALLEEDEEKKKSLMTVSIVGGGPTGVELAGAIGEMKKHMLPNDYKELDINNMQVHLFEATDKLLGPMSESSQKRALSYLKSFGVHVHLKSAVKSYDGNTLTLANNDTIHTDTVIWTAGVKGIPVNGLPKESLYPNGRIKVNAYNQVEGLENIYAIGDISCMVSENLPRGHAMVAPVGIQQGQLLAKNLMREKQGITPKAFNYFDKGSMATVGRNRAVVDFPGNKIKMGGLVAWSAWMVVHLMSLVGFRNKMIVLTGWLYNYMNYDRVLRLIIHPSKKRVVEKINKEIEESILES
ncbi:MAG: NAD(P)/FAD-dependent oxidoreductase [Chitinophagales bacterium]|nr:NAD(P)/FAD-dependent oxidoreductase [Chitinophagales bacterium]